MLRSRWARDTAIGLLSLLAGLASFALARRADLSCRAVLAWLALGTAAVSRWHDDSAVPRGGSGVLRWSGSVRHHTACGWRTPAAGPVRLVRLDVV